MCVCVWGGGGGQKVLSRRAALLCGATLVRPGSRQRPEPPLPACLPPFPTLQKWSYSGGQTAERRSARARTLAVWIREQILQLGPTYIKIGQVGRRPGGSGRCGCTDREAGARGKAWSGRGSAQGGGVADTARHQMPCVVPCCCLQLFSTRSDLFPPEFTEELSKLQVGDGGPAGGASGCGAPGVRSGWGRAGLRLEWHASLAHADYVTNSTPPCLPARDPCPRVRSTGPRARVQRGQG